MKKQAVLSVLLIFLFTLTLLFVGLNLSERAMQQVSGTTDQASALSFSRNGAGAWVLTFAGRQVVLNRQLWQR